MGFQRLFVCEAGYAIKDCACAMCQSRIKLRERLMRCEHHIALYVLKTIYTFGQKQSFVMGTSPGRSSRNKMSASELLSTQNWVMVKNNNSITMKFLFYRTTSAFVIDSYVLPLQGLFDMHFKEGMPTTREQAMDTWYWLDVPRVKDTGRVEFLLNWEDASDHVTRLEPRFHLLCPPVRPIPPWIRCITVRIEDMSDWNPCQLFATVRLAQKHVDRILTCAPCTQTHTIVKAMNKNEKDRQDHVEFITIPLHTHPK